MFRLLYEILKDFGALGIGIIQFIVILWGGWKLFTNHLHHIQNAIHANGKKIEKTTENIIKLRERVSKIEGQLK